MEALTRLQLPTLPPPPTPLSFHLPTPLYMPFVIIIAVAVKKGAQNPAVLAS